MFKLTTQILSASILSLAVNFAYAADTQNMGNMNMQSDMGSPNMQMHKGHGIANKINAKAGKINISHEPIDTMNWPKMTMDFTVQNKTDLEAIKPGMAVDFEITQQGKGYRISHIVPAK